MEGSQEETLRNVDFIPYRQVCRAASVFTAWHPLKKKKKKIMQSPHCRVLLFLA